MIKIPKQEFKWFARIDARRSELSGMIYFRYWMSGENNYPAMEAYRQAERRWPMSQMLA
jgi:hypothetical protein